MGDVLGPLLVVALLCAAGFAYGAIATLVIDRLVGVVGQRLRARRDAHDPYPPEAAEAPDPVVRQFAEVGDTFGFSSRGVPPGPVAEGFEAELYEAIRRYRCGEDIETGAPREAW